jgi:hypothetical protein
MGNGENTQENFSPPITKSQSHQQGLIREAHHEGNENHKIGALNILHLIAYNTKSVLCSLDFSSASIGGSTKFPLLWLQSEHVLDFDRESAIQDCLTPDCGPALPHMISSFNSRPWTLDLLSPFAS